MVRTTTKQGDAMAPVAADEAWYEEHGLREKAKDMTEAERRMGFGLGEQEYKEAQRSSLLGCDQYPNPANGYEGSHGIQLARDHAALVLQDCSLLRNAPTDWRVTAVQGWMANARSNLHKEQHNHPAPSPTPSAENMDALSAENMDAPSAPTVTQHPVATSASAAASSAAWPLPSRARLQLRVSLRVADGNGGHNWLNRGTIDIDWRHDHAASAYEDILSTLHYHCPHGDKHRPFYIWPCRERDVPIGSPLTLLARLDALAGGHWAHLSVAPGLPHRLDVADGGRFTHPERGPHKRQTSTDIHGDGRATKRRAPPPERGNSPAGDHDPFPHRPTNRRNNQTDADSGVLYDLRMSGALGGPREFPVGESSPRHSLFGTGSDNSASNNSAPPEHNHDSPEHNHDSPKHNHDSPEHNHDSSSSSGSDEGEEDEEVADTPDVDEAFQVDGQEGEDGAVTADNYEQEVLNETMNRLSSSLAADKAMYAEHEQWRAAAEMLGASLRAMLEQSIAPSPYISISPDLGLSPHLKLMAHQIVGVDALHNLTFGPKRGGVLSDYMGMGKTIQVLVTWWSNLSQVKQRDGLAVKSQRLMPVDAQGTYRGRRPRVGATYISAHPSGVEPWVRDFAKIMRDCPALKDSDWRPKMIVLHGSGEDLVRKYGGADMGLHAQISPEDIREISPEPDWATARACYGTKHDLELGVHGATWTCKGESNWRPHPAATKDRPSPTSTRFIIVSTNQCWSSRLYDVWNPRMDPYKQALRHLAKTKIDRPRAPVQIRHAELAVDRSRDHCYKSGSDLTQRHHVRRKAVWLDGKGKPHDISVVVELYWAAWLLVDEVHAAGSENTLTYRVVVEPFLTHMPAAQRPAITAITGSMLANGITTTLVFAAKALNQPNNPEWAALNDVAVQKIKTLDAEDIMNTWHQFTKIAKAGVGLSMATLIANNPAFAALLDTFGHIFAAYFIKRDYLSKDPTGQTLKLMDAKLNKTYLLLPHDQVYHRKLRAVEDALSSSVEQRYQADMTAYRDSIARGQLAQKPARLRAARADPTGYHRAKVLASFPNFVDAILAYQQRHPQRTPLFSSADTANMGPLNKKLAEILSSPKKMQGSIIYACIDEICNGSEKMRHIERNIMAHCTGYSTAPSVGQGTEMQYRNKYTIVTNIRVCKAILYCKLVKMFGPEWIAYVGDGTQTTHEITRFRGTTADAPCILIAGIRSICQSMDLIECHVFEGLEPHLINADAVQYGYRGYRIGQTSDTVTVNWLVHAGSQVEVATYKSNKAKDDFEAGVGTTELDKTAEDEEVGDADEV